MNVRYRLARRGAIYKIFDFEFPDLTKPKFCLLLEDINNFSNSLIIAFTTHENKFEYKETVIRATVKGIPGATFIDLYNYKEIPVEILLNENKSAHINNLSEDKMVEIDKALKRLHINHDIWIRMQPNEEPY